MKSPSSVVLIAAIVLTVDGCATSATQTGDVGLGPASDPDPAPDPAHNARNSLDWAGAYRGVLPCADCPGIETVVVLADDGTYRSRSRYLGEEGTTFSEEGRFTWNEAGNTVTLAGSRPAQYFVGENRLLHLNLDGSRVTGELAEHYALTRLTEGVTGRYWKLVELMGQSVPALEREPYFILEAEEGRVHGFGGCNGFSGTYRLDESTLRISFDQVVSTMKACPSGMDVERAFHDVLRTVDNYSLSDDHLTLNRARMAPLARFEAVYLP